MKSRKTLLYKFRFLLKSFADLQFSIIFGAVLPFFIHTLTIYNLFLSVHAFYYNSFGHHLDPQDLLSFSRKLEVQLTSFFKTLILH